MFGFVFPATFPSKSGLLLFCLLLLLVFPTPAWAKNGTISGEAMPAGESRISGISFRCPVWDVIVPGLEFGHADLPEGNQGFVSVGMVMLRIDPSLFAFSLHMATEEGTSYSLREWSERHDLSAGINASMFLPDNVTSTGYMRSPSHVNNARAGGRLGAFFVAAPREKGLPQADILENDSDNWREAIERYGLVVQNFRLISQSGQVLWPDDGPAHSIAVVAEDKAGRILFILCQLPLSPAVFARHVQELALDIGSVMYVEGGSHAGLFLREPGTDTRPPRPGARSYAVPGGTLHVWKGRQNLLNTRSDPEARLPNILGIRPVPEPAAAGDPAAPASR